MRIYTRKGDEGTTSLLFGGRVSKADPRTDAYGTADQAVSAMGLARALCQNGRVQEILLQTQREMFVVGADLATDPAQREHLTKHFEEVTPRMVSGLEATIDEVDEVIDLPRAFIVPGGSAGSAALDLARSTLRAAERRIVELNDAGVLANPEVLRYVNRLSDLLFMLARLEDKDQEYELSKDESRTGDSQTARPG